MRKAKSGGDVQMTGDRTAAREIAAARAAFNQALADRDYGAVEAVLCADCTLTPGDDAALIDGREAQIEAWRSLVSQAPDVAYVRAPRRIDVAEDGRLAAETGRWRGAWSSDGVGMRYSGAYFAKWRFEADGWKIASEVFVTLSRAAGAD
ncbi:MAG: nuclear transport factor 2 family protein [Oceanicaulis sp.]